jgi:hypothetical protein
MKIKCIYEYVQVIIIKFLTMLMDLIVPVAWIQTQDNCN